jgi:hypothetical protein
MDRIDLVLVICIVVITIVSVVCGIGYLSELGWIP